MLLQLQQQQHHSPKVLFFIFISTEGLFCLSVCLLSISKVFNTVNNALKVNFENFIFYGLKI